MGDLYEQRFTDKIEELESSVKYYREERLKFKNRIEELERQLDLAQQANRRLIQQLANQDKTNDPSLHCV